MTRPPLPRAWPIAATLLLLAACGLNPDRTGSGPEATRPAPRADRIEATPPTSGTTGSPKMLEHDVACREVPRLLLVQRFTLDEPHEYHWMKDHPDVTSGSLVVVEVEPECARPRQAAMPVLYAGGVPAEIAKDSYPSGRLVLVVPGDVDLAATPLFFGAPELPERVDRETGARELAAARSDGIEPFPAGVVAAAEAGPVLRLVDTTDLYGAAYEIDARLGGTPPSPTP